MTNRALTSVALLAVAVSTFAVACAGGGGNSGAPCCGATGQVEQQPAFAPFAPGDLRAEPVVFAAPGGCVDASPAGLSIDEFVRVGRSAAIVDGRYDVTIRDGFRDQPVFIRIFPEGDDETTLGFGVVPTESAETDVLYRVARIDVDATAPFSLGESTVELVAFCRLRALVMGTSNALQNMQLTDVRAAITTELAETFDPSVPIDGAAAGGAGAYRHAINGVVNFIRDDTDLVDPAAFARRFRNLRIRAESFVDSCRDGVKPDPQSRIACDPADPDLDLRAEFYRGWALTRLASDEQVAFARFGVEDHVLAFTQDYAEALGNLTTGTNLIAVGMHRRGHMLRFEAADFAIQNAAFDLGLSAADLVTVNSSLELVRGQILTATIPDEYVTAWSDASPAIVNVFAAHTGFNVDNGPCTVAASNSFQDQYNAARANAEAAQNTLSAGSSHAEIVGALFAPTTSGGVRGKIAEAMAACPNLTPVEQAALANVYTHLSLNEVRVPQT